MASGTLRVRILGDSGPLEKTLGGLGGIAGKAFAAIGVASGAAAAKSIVDFTGFERKMNEVFTLLPGISQDAMGDMTEQVKDFSKEFGVLPDEVVPSLYQALSAGVPSDNVFEFMETAQKAAAGGVTELETAVDGISSVVNSYGDDVVSAGEASDLMFTAVRLGKTNFEELSSTLSNVIPIASGLGVNFEDVSAGLAAMTAQGTPTAQATTQLRQLFVELSKSGGAAAGTFEEMAGKTFQEFIAEGGNTAEALDVMAQAADEAGVPIQDLFGSVEAGGAALQLTSSEAFVDNLGEMQDAAGATDDAFQTMEQGIGPVWDKLKSGASVALLDLGERLAPIIQHVGELALGLLPKMGDAFGVISGWWSANGPGIIDGFREVAAAVREWVTEALERLSAWWTTNGPTIVSAVQRIAAVVQDVLVAAFTALSDWWATNGPAVMAAAETMVAGLVTAFDKLASAAEFVRNNWSRIGPIVQGIAALIVTLLIPHYIALGITATKSAAKQLAAWVANSTAALRHGATILAQIAVVVAKWAFMGAQSLLHAAKVAAAWLIAMGPIGLVIAAVVALVAVIVKNWDKITEVIGKGWDWVKKKTSEFVAAVVGFVIGMRDKTVKAVTDLKDRVVGFFSNIRDLVVKAATTLAANVIAKFLELKNGALDKVVELVTWLQGLPGRVLDAVGDLGTLLLEAGKDVLRGFINGVRDMASEAASAVTGAISDAAAGVTRFLGISSPSRLFFEYGADTMQGYIDGAKERGEELKTTMFDIFNEMSQGVSTIVGGIGAIGGRGGAQRALQDARDDLQRLLDREQQLPGEQRRLTAAVAAESLRSLQVDPAEEAAIIRARQRVADAERALAEAQADRTKSADDVRLAEIDVLQAQEQLTQAQQDAVAPSQKLLDLQDELRAVKEESATLDDEIQEARQRLTDAELRAVEAEQQLLKAGQDLIGLSPDQQAMFENLASSAGLTSEAIDRLIGRYEALAQITSGPSSVDDRILGSGSDSDLANRIRDIFRNRDVSLGFGARTGETEAQRLRRLVDEVRSGRELDDIRRSVDLLAEKQTMQVTVNGNIVTDSPQDFLDQLNQMARSR